MRFADPQYLWYLLLLPLLVLAAAWVHGRRRRALERFAGGAEYTARFTLAVSRHRRAIRLLALHAALGALTVALARPQWGTRIESIPQHGADVVVVLDTSWSMAAEDLAPSRLEQAKHAIDSLLTRVAGDRVALVTFAGRASVLCPLTADHAAVRLFLDAIDVETTQFPGTAIAEALRTAAAAFGPAAGVGDARDRAVVLFSDGEDHAGGLDEAVAALEQAGIGAYVVGCGTARGAPIPLRERNGTLAGYKKDREGKLVTTRLDESALEKLALDTKGHYHRATVEGAEIEDLAAALSGLRAGEIGAERRVRYEERFQVPLALGWAALVAETLLGDRRRRRRAAADAEAA